eukprot:8716768-Alexandrium_andersonii.AAC.1
MALLVEYRDVARRVIVVGGNLAVARYCAAQGRLHRLATQQQLERPLASLAWRGLQGQWVA